MTAARRGVGVTASHPSDGRAESASAWRASGRNKKGRIDGSGLARCVFQEQFSGGVKTALQSGAC